MAGPLDSSPEGYAVRPPTLADVAAVNALIAAVDLADAGEADDETEDLRAEWAKSDLAADAWLVVAPDGAVAGYAIVGDRARVRLHADVYVHPDHLGRGVGTALTRLTERRATERVVLAPAGARVILSTTVDSVSVPARQLLEGEGYRVARHFWQMRADLVAPPPAPAWPAGVTVRPFVAGQDEGIVYGAIGESFADMWGFIPPPFDDWRAFMIARADFDPSLWTLAFAGEEVAGAALCYRFPERGWVRSLGVRRPWRRQGLGLALLQHTFGEFWRRGERQVGLGVDAQSLTGATRLYERAGMYVARRFDQWQKELRPGEGLGARVGAAGE